MGRRLLLAFLVLLSLSGAGIAWMSRHSFQRQTIQIPAGWSAKMLEDDTLFLEKWLSRRGWNARRTGGLIQSKELPPRGVVILLHLSHPISEDEVDTLLAWVKEGGLLVVDGSAAPFNDGLGTRLLFKRLGAELVSIEDKKSPGSEPGTDRFSRDETPYAMRRNDAWRLKVDRSTWDDVLGNDKGEVMVQRAEGHGKVTLASDLSFLYNMQFGELDHAAWLSRILGDPAPGSAAVVWSRPVDRALLPWLWARAWAFLIACGVLLVAWLWRGLWRFGPMLPDPPATRRSLREHLAACGRFLWRHGGQEALVAASRAAVLRRAAKLHSAFPVLAEEDRWAYLAERSNLSVPEIAEALDDRPGATTEILARRLQMLQLLRHRLYLTP